MRLLLRILLGLLLAVILLAISMNILARSQRVSEAAYHDRLPKTIRLKTGKIGVDSLLAQECTCKGPERSPDLHWQTSLTNVKSFALIMIDPDVPSPAFPLFTLTHWVIYDIPPTYVDLPGGMITGQITSQPVQFGKNSMGEQKYIGPCPPVGKHAYIFKIYALDKRLTPAEPLKKPQLLDAMQGHILGYGELKTYYAAE